MSRKPRKSGVTNAHVAKVAGVSVATVSRVFNRSDAVKPDVAAKVMKIAEELNFIPQQASRSDTLVLVIEKETAELLSNYVSSIIQEVVMEVSKQKLRLDIVTSDDIGLIRGKYVIGVLGIMWNMDSIRKFENISDTKSVGINISSSQTTVCSDEHQGMRLAIEHLVSKGHQHLGMTVRPFDNYGDQQRRRAFDEIISENKALVGKTISYDGSSKDMLSELIKIYGPHKRSHGSKPTALIATSDSGGIHLMQNLSYLGVDVPGDVSVVAHEAPHVSQYLVPALSTVAQDYKSIVNHAIALIKGDQKRPKGSTEILIPQQLIERDSVNEIQLP